MQQRLSRSARRRYLRALVALSAVSALTGLMPLPAAAQGGENTATDYPNKTIRYVGPFAAGGRTNIMARVVGHQLSEQWKKPIVVDNKPGGNANIGAD